MIYLLITVLVWFVSMLMLWRFLKLSKIIKWILTIIFSLLALFTFLFFLFFYVVYKVNLSKGEVTYTPTSPIQSIFECNPLNTQWSECIYPDSQISFEYPINWFYTRYNSTSSEDLQFGPVNPVKGSNQAVILYISEYKDETDAYNKVKNSFMSIKGEGGETTFNGFQASLNPDGKSVIFQYKKQTFLFVLDDFNSPKNGISKEQAKAGFEHMIQTFKIKS